MKKQSWENATLPLPFQRNVHVDQIYNGSGSGQVQMESLVCARHVQLQTRSRCGLWIEMECQILAEHSCEQANVKVL